jgi:hypothetical protein
MLLAEEDEGLGREGIADLGEDALRRLDLAIEKIEAAGDADPKIEAATRYLRREGWADRAASCLAASIDVLNLRYRGSVEDEVHHALSSRLEQIRAMFGTIPDTLEDVWVATALGEIAEARHRIQEVPAHHPFDLRYAEDLPQTAWERCAQVLDRYDVQRRLREAW